MQTAEEYAALAEQHLLVAAKAENGDDQRFHLSAAHVYATLASTAQQGVAAGIARRGAEAVQAALQAAEEYAVLPVVKHGTEVTDADRG